MECINFNEFLEGPFGNLIGSYGPLLAILINLGGVLSIKKVPYIRSRLDRSVDLLYKRCNSVPVG